mmetsp:Transcript_1410/g.8684  ORF Transcript_1410/g.8684 Transcript_1410/m.8684 type:complete len:288 (+) Transcript_1410:2908-3771(+)
MIRTVCFLSPRGSCSRFERLGGWDGHASCPYHGCCGTHPFPLSRGYVPVRMEIAYGRTFSMPRPFFSPFSLEASRGERWFLLLHRAMRARRFPFPTRGQGALLSSSSDGREFAHAHRRSRSFPSFLRHRAWWDVPLALVCFAWTRTRRATVSLGLILARRVHTVSGVGFVRHVRRPCRTATVRPFSVAANAVGTRTATKATCTRCWRAPCWRWKTQSARWKKNWKDKPKETATKKLPRTSMANSTSQTDGNVRRHPANSSSTHHHLHRHWHVRRKRTWRSLLRVPRA